MKRLLSLLIFLVLPLIFTAASAERYTATFIDVFDTASQIIIYTDDQKEANRIAQTIHQELQYYHRLFDQYHDTPGVNGVYMLNRKASIEPIRVDAPLFRLLQLGKEMYVKTGGKINIAMGSVLSLWHDARVEGLNDPQNAAIPDLAALKEAAGHINPEHIVLDTDKQTVFFADPKLQIDLGAVAKGYAVEQIADLLKANGDTGIVLSIGGNVRTIGCRPDGTVFSIGIQNPDLASETQHIAVVALQDASLVTSGSYQRYFEVDGKPYHHIIDPDTLMPAEHAWSVSIITQDSGLADALSTTLFTMTPEDGIAFLKKYPGTEALWVLHDGSLLYSEGLEALLVK